MMAMDTDGDTTRSTSSEDAATMNRRLLEQLLMMMLVDSLWRKGSTATATGDGDEDSLNEMMNECTPIMRRDQSQSLFSQEPLVATQRLLNAQLLHLMNEQEEKRSAVPSWGASDQQQQLMDDAAADAKKKKRAAAAAAKKKRYKRNKAAAKHKKTTIMSWRGGGIIISLIMMAAFGSYMVVPLSLIQQIDGSGEGEAPPALPPSASRSRSLRQKQKDLQSDNVNAELESASPNVFSTPYAAVVPPPIFSPTFVGNQRMKPDENERASMCFDTPNWKDVDGDGCGIYEGCDPGCPGTDDYAGDMGPATQNCCFCGGGSHTLPPTTSPKPTGFPTMSAHPTQFCIDTLNWEDVDGFGCDWYEDTEDPRCPGTDDFAGDMGPASQNCCYCGKGPCIDTPNWNDGVHGCAWYEENDSPGCPKYGELFGEKVMGLPKNHCCYCQRDVVALVTPSAPPSISALPTIIPLPTKTEAPSISSTYAYVASCVDTPEWMGTINPIKCDWYTDNEEVGCPKAGNLVGVMGSAIENCCQCGGGSRTCEDFKSKCKAYFHIIGILEGVVSPFCERAESCSCEATAVDHDVKIATTGNYNLIQTDGLHNECKCNFWSSLCEGAGVGEGEACDYAAEYCCGDYEYEYYDGKIGDEISFVYLNSPACFCDFFNYAQNKFDYALKAKALMINKEFQDPCAQVDLWVRGLSISNELQSLEAIYEGTNGENWTNSAGWMNEEDHCEWHGVTCDVDGFVTSIDLRDNNLAGHFPVYARDFFDADGTWMTAAESEWKLTKYGLANLYNLETLDFADNKLTGTIEYRPLYNLHSLTHFDVSGNQLSGDVNAHVSPSLIYADFSNNRFRSMLNLKRYKGSFRTLRFCDVSNNDIQQDASVLLENIPPNIEQFVASNNQITGSLPASLNDLPQLRQFNLSSNALSGELPGFAESILTLQELDLSNQNHANGFTGSISKDLWKFQSLRIFNLAGNKIAGPIPPAIGKMTALEVFDLSNNLLSGRIPFQIGRLEGTLQFLGLANNFLSGVIPSQLGRFQGASVLLKDNQLDAAPLSLCLESEVNEFDLKNNATVCPIERNALVDFYDSVKGAEWTDRTNWLNEYRYCDWNGVTCDDMNHVTELNLSNNGLSGRLSESIGNLSFIEVLDLSDNDIKGSIPTQIGLLSKLTYLRLSYNAFTGAAPEGLGELTQVKLLQLQSNRITELPNIPELDKSLYSSSTFVSDCGVPSAFDEPLECDNCTMCCNANEDCYPQEDTRTVEWGMSYGTFATALFAGFVVLCCVVVFFLYLFSKRKNRGKALTMSMDLILKKDDMYALSTIGKNSVYSYFVTNQVVGWLLAMTTIGLQVVILAVFVKASEANLQDDKIDLQFTWKCPRDSDVCKDQGDLTKAGWAIFSVLMIAYLAKDVISGCKLIYHSSKSRHPLRSRIRYFIGGLSLCSITLFAFYISTVYNKAIATSNTEIIVNSVIILFVMELDEWIFSALEASNKKWTEHAADSESCSYSEAEKGDEIEEMKDEIASQKAQIASQQEELEILRSQQEELMLLQDQVTRQNDEVKMLREAMKNIQESLAAAAPTASASAPQSPVNESATKNIAESEDTSSDTNTGNGGTMNEAEGKSAHQKDENAL